MFFAVLNRYLIPILICCVSLNSIHYSTEELVNKYLIRNKTIFLSIDDSFDYFPKHLTLYLSLNVI